jgi:hypothetical protein
MGVASGIDVEAAATEVFAIARYLFALEPAFADAAMAYVVAFEADPGRLGDPRGKYIRNSSGYIYIAENGDGCAIRELPEGVTADQVIEDSLDVSSATPMQDRLKEIAAALRTSAGASPDAEALASAIAAILLACRAENNQLLFAAIKRKAVNDVLDAVGSSDDINIVQRATHFLDELDELIIVVRGGPRADGRLIAGLLALLALIRADAERAGSPAEQKASLISWIRFIAAAPSEASIELVAVGMCAEMIGNGQSALVRKVADELKGQGDALIDEALDGDARSFYPPLYASAAYETAAVLLARAVAECTEDPKEKLRSTRVADNGEERGVRVANSLSFAVRNRDGRAAAQHVVWLREVRETEGKTAARLKAEDLILQYFYPRSDLPILLGENLPPGDRLTRT